MIRLSLAALMLCAAPAAFAGAIPPQASAEVTLRLSGTVLSGVSVELILPGEKPDASSDLQQEKRA